MANYFKEEQKFTQWWIWLLIIPIGILPIITIYKQFFLGEKFGNKPMNNIGLVIFAVFIFVCIGLFFIMKLQTKIDHRKIAIHFFPFVKKKISWTDIKKAKVINYSFVGGWGIRLWTKYGTVYNIKGNKGLAIELKNGKKLLIGTQKEDALQAFLKNVPLIATY